MSKDNLSDRQFPAIGSRWTEADPRFHRVVEVVGHDEARGKVAIKTAGQSGLVTWAKVERFNGKRGGYAQVAEAS